MHPGAAAPFENLLPCDGEAYYFGRAFAAEEADPLFEALFATVPWQHDETVMFGKRIVTARKVAWLADEALAYTYSGITKQARPWTNEVLEIKARIERLTQTSFNSCLLNLYHDGNEGMGWHSDDEKDLARHAAIASISLGAERKFVFKHKRLPEKVEVRLEHGSLLLMRGETQSHWLHSLPKSKRITTPRINLTFRTIAARRTA